MYENLSYEEIALLNLLSEDISKKCDDADHFNRINSQYNIHISNGAYNGLDNKKYIERRVSNCVHKTHMYLTNNGRIALQYTMKCSLCEKITSSIIDDATYCRMHAILLWVNELSEDELKAVKDHINE
jgi:hypothetical protein